MILQKWPENDVPELRPQFAAFVEETFLLWKVDVVRLAYYHKSRTHLGLE
jgi:hypothetical protein